MPEPDAQVALLKVHSGPPVTALQQALARSQTAQSLLAVDDGGTLGGAAWASAAAAEVVPASEWRGCRRRIWLSADGAPSALMPSDPPAAVAEVSHPASIITSIGSTQTS